MKKLSIIAAFILTIVTSAFADDKKAPAFKGADHFKSAFPSATIDAYEIKGKYTVVNFTWNGLKLQSFYDAQGNSIGTSREIAIHDLPLSYLANIRSEYPDYALVQAIEFDHTTEGLKYYVTVQGAQRSYVLEISPEGTISVFKKMKN